MIRLSALVLAFGISCVSASLVGCGSAASKFAAPAPSVTNDAVKIQLTDQDGNTFKFLVWNRTDKHMTLLRDEIALVVGGVSYRRIPGGLLSSYDVPPGGSHDVNVRYDANLFEEADRFQIAFGKAVVQGGEPVGAPAIEFIQRSR